MRITQLESGEWQDENGLIYPAHALQVTAISLGQDSIEVKVQLGEPKDD